MWSPRQVTHLPPFPWHRHQIEGTNGFYCLIRKTERFTISNVESQVFTPRIILAYPGRRARAAGVQSVRPTTWLTAPLYGRTTQPHCANLFMEDYEGKALEAYQDPPTYWGRYVDYALAVIKTANIEPFPQHLNTQHTHTSNQWTSELETDGTLPMLDTLTTRRRDGPLKFSVYRKPTHTDQYLQFQSHQPMEHTMRVIRTLTHRADTIISDPQDK